MEKRKKERVLVLTDNSYQTERIADHFRKINAEVYLARNRQEAREVIERQEADNNPIDILFLEEIISGATTKPLFKFLRKTQPDLGVVLLYESDKPYMTNLRSFDEMRNMQDPLVCLKRGKNGYDSIPLSDSYVVALRLRNEKRERVKAAAEIIEIDEKSA